MAPKPVPALPGEWRHNPHNPCNQPQHNPDMWADPQTTHDTKTAIRLSTQCPSRQPCHQFATNWKTRQTEGIWGATLPQHR